jgi:hypothetical protein
MRSEASTPVQVDTLAGSPPDAPVGLAAARLDGFVEVLFDADAPTTPAGDFVFDVLRIDNGLRTFLARSTAATARQATPTHFAVLVDAEAVRPGEQILVRATDPEGRAAESIPIVSP